MAKGSVKQKQSVRTRTKPAAPAGAAVSGAEPYRPKMSAAQKRSAVEAQLGERVKLADYRKTVTALKPAQRDQLIGQATEMLDQVYAHLPLKRALHANDPIQSLRLLRLRHASLSEREFQSALMEIFLGLRDLHTNYILPTVYAQKYAFLPFRVEEFYELGGVLKEGTDPRLPKYIVSWVSPVNTVATLKERMVVTHWNGSPIALAVARNGNREAGSNADARRAQGVEALTLRWLGMSLPPDEDWVNLTYTDGAKTYEARFDWEVIDSPDRAALLAGWDTGARIGRKLGLDLKRLLLDRARKLIFDPQAVLVEKDAKKHLAKAGAAVPAPRADASVFPSVFPWFGEVTTPSGKFGYIRLKSFDPEVENSDIVDKVTAEFVRILKTLPQTGLILDVRGNGGGYIEIGEQILQTLTPWQITPEPFQFLATPLTLKIVSDTKNSLGDWKDTVVQGLESGASFSQGFPLSDPDKCNAIGQIYQGPVVLVTDALCYSTTDIFSAGFQDHQIGTVLGCHSSTGAGGANVWEYYKELKPATASISPKPFDGLPGGADMRVAIRRSTRVGSRSGIPVEDYGVTSDVRYLMTKADVVGNNNDLKAAAAKILKGLPTQTLGLKPDPSDPLRKFLVDCSNIDRIDLFVNDRPALSQEVSRKQAGLPVVLPFAAAAGSVVAAKGYREEVFQGDRQEVLVVSTRLTAGS
jgi:C-terminal processing protease CtpA/Prc